MTDDFGKKKIILDVQSLIQSVVVLGSIIWFLVNQTSRISVLETTLHSQVDLSAKLAENQRDIVKLYNTHLNEAAGELAEFQMWKDRVEQIEKRLKIRQ